MFIIKYICYLDQFKVKLTVKYKKTFLVNEGNTLIFFFLSLNSFYLESSDIFDLFASMMMSFLIFPANFLLRGIYFSGTLPKKKVV